MAGLLKLNKVKKVDGTAKFTGEKQLEVTKADGSRNHDRRRYYRGYRLRQCPAPIPGLKENPNCIDSTGALSLEKLPQTMVVIGGGVIGLGGLRLRSLRHQDHRGGGYGHRLFMLGGDRPESAAPQRIVRHGLHPKVHL